MSKNGPLHSNEQAKQDRRTQKIDYHYEMMVRTQQPLCGQNSQGDQARRTTCAAARKFELVINLNAAKAR
jgi:hypothetical protein